MVWGVSSTLGLFGEAVETRFAARRRGREQQYQASSKLKVRLPPVLYYVPVLQWLSVTHE
jgi:hypothetical protein